MKNLIYLFFAAIMLVFMACGGGYTATQEIAEEAVVEDVISCTDDCKKACCLGCKATEGEASCALLATQDHSCCTEVEGHE